MPRQGMIPSVDGMNSTAHLNWPVILGLGSFALVRPLVSIVNSTLGVSAPPTVPIALTLVISVVWIAVVGLSRNPRPVLTLLLTGVTYAVLAMILSAILSPILTGSLQGPLANPVALIPLLLTNVLWGLITGGLALALQRIRGIRAGHTITDR